MNQTAFSVLKKDKSISGKLSSSFSGIFFFWIKEDDFGAYAECCDKRKKYVRPVPPLYRGAVRDALESYSAFHRATSWQIDWGRSDDRLYLIDNPEFTKLLLRCNNLLLPTGEAVDTVETQDYGYLKIKSRQKDETIVWKVCFCPDESMELCNFRFLTPSLIISERNIYKVLPVQEYNQINLFNCTLKNDETEKFLSIFFSAYPDAKVKYFDYKVEIDGRINSEPALVLEKVDATGSLYLDVASSSKGVDLEFLNSYNLDRIVSVDKENSVLKVSSLISVNITEYADKIEKLLKHHQNKKNPDLGYTRLDNLFILQS
ncbi:MAG: hypothetical protein U9N32_10720, partial [Spirochaetota bacterium]|nr:hypothetical protein [Spirochaetota bacterium]